MSYVRRLHLINLTTMTPVTNQADVKSTYNDNEVMSSSAPVALTFEYGLVNDFLLEWSNKKKELCDGAITPNEYFEWKITWPQG